MNWENHLMRNRHFRRAARISVLGTAALLTTLTLTACQADGQATTNSAAPAPAGPSGQPAGSPKAPADQVRASTGFDSNSVSVSNATDDGPVTLACDGGNSKVTLTAVPRPVNHMLLTVTNTGSKACNAYYYPFLKFGGAQAVPPVYEESKPQAVVTLMPGQSAYTGVTTASADGSGTDGYSTNDLTVSFQSRDGSGSSGPSAKVPLTKAVHVDSTLTVTYWQTEMDDALMY